VCFTPDACLGGNDTSVQCAPSQLQGSAYCSVCAVGYHGGGDGKLCAECEGNQVLTFLPLLVLGAVLIFVAFGWLCSHLLSSRARADTESSISVRHQLSRRASRAKHQLYRVARGLGVKLRILIALIQMLSGVSVAFAIPYPEAYLSILRWISAIELNLPASLPLGCILEVQYYHKLVIMTAIPLAVLLLLAILTRVCAQREGLVWIGSASNTALAALLFLLYPSVSTSLFSYFICDTLDGEGEDGARLLRVDYSITCGSDEYNAFVPYVMFMIGVFPIGTPLLYMLLMFQQRDQLAQISRVESRVGAVGQLFVASRLSVTADGLDDYTNSKRQLAQKSEELRSELKGVLLKVTDGYRMSCYWFELFECARKILLVGLPVFLPPGSPGQLLCGLIVSFGTACAFAKFEPYINPSDGRLQLVCQFEIFFALLSSLVLKADPQNRTLAALLPALLLAPPLFALLFTLLDKDGTATDKDTDLSTSSFLHRQSPPEAAAPLAAAASRAPSDVKATTTTFISPRDHEPVPTSKTAAASGGEEHDAPMAKCTHAFDAFPTSSTPNFAHELSSGRKLQWISQKALVGRASHLDDVREHSRGRPTSSRHRRGRSHVNSDGKEAQGQPQTTASCSPGSLAATSTCTMTCTSATPSADHLCA
jgi:hypothetical protein